MAVESDQMVDLSDLALLGDGDAHAHCTFCQPEVAALEPFVALCGTRAVCRNPAADPLTPPPNACVMCAEAWDQPCFRCGAR